MHQAATAMEEEADLQSLAAATRYLVPDGEEEEKATAAAAEMVLPDATGIDLEQWEADLMMREGEGFRRAQEQRTRARMYSPKSVMIAEEKVRQLQRATTTTAMSTTDRKL
jgi:hypothetical protein